MAFETLISYVQSIIKTNFNGEITPEKHQGVLINVINTLGSGYVFNGYAVTTTDPDTQEGNLAYLAKDVGTYTELGGVEITSTGVYLITRTEDVWALQLVSPELDYTELARWMSIGEMFEENTSIDDRGVNLVGGEMTIGSPGNGKELVVVEGDSYPVGDEESLAFHFDYANLSGLTITGATDITEILQSDNGSTTGLFGSHLAGSAILVGSNHRYGGVKAKMAAQGIVEPANVMAEYLQDNSPTWVYAPYMATDADNINSIGSQKGWALGTCDSCSEHWYFGFDPLDLPTTWDMVTLTIDGVPHTKYWSIFRVVNTITQDITLEQLKFHTNRWECNADGSTQYFGRSRYARVLQSGINNLDVNVAGSAQNENISYTPNIVVERKSNEFRNGFTDDTIITQTIPVGLDTSIPLLLNISYYPVSGVTGDVEFEAEVVKVSDGFIYDGTASTTTYSAIETLTSGIAAERTTTTIKVLVNDLTDADGIVVRLKRDATAGNPDDTLASNVVLTHFEMIGYFWRP